MGHYHPFSFCKYFSTEEGDSMYSRINKMDRSNLAQITSTESDNVLSMMNHYSIEERYDQVLQLFYDTRKVIDWLID